MRPSKASLDLPFCRHSLSQALAALDDVAFMSDLDPVANLAQGHAVQTESYPLRQRRVLRMTVRRERLAEELFAGW